MYSCVLLGNYVVAFLNGNIFGYLLHAVEIVLAELLVGYYLEKRKAFALRLLLTLVAYLALSVIFGVVFEKIFPYFRYLIAFLFSFIIFPICYRANIWDELFCLVSAIVMQNLAYSSSAFLIGLLGWNPVEVDLFYSSLQVLIYVVIQIIVLKICAKWLKDVRGSGEERLSMILLSFVLTIVVYIIQHDRQSLNANDFLWWRAMFISYDVLSLFMLFGMYDRSKLRRENAILDSLRVSEEKQYEFDKHAIEMVNIKCHDLKHQLVALRGLTGIEQEQAIAEMESAVLFYNAVAKTGCKPLDVILSNKYLLCEHYGIDFTYMIDGEKLSFMKSSDVYSLFGNALDNAIRAEMNVADVDKRLISIVVSTRGGLLNIHMENYYEGEIKFKNGLPMTTQKDVNNHGFGTISMKRIVERYGGVMSIECVNNMFCLDITIPIMKLVAD